MRWLATALLLAACSAEDGQLTGSWTIHYQTGSGEISRPGDWRGAGFDILIEEEGGARSSAVPAVEGGRFTIDAPATARYYLRRRAPDAERLDVWFSRGDDVTVEHGALGRPDLERPAEPATLTIEASGLSPWQSASFQVVSPGVGAAFRADAGDIEPGATEMSLEIPWPHPLPDARRGDQLIALQHVVRDRSRVVENMLAAGPTTLLEGEPNLVQGEFVPVSRRSIAATVELRDLSDHIPGAEIATLSVRALPRAGRYGWYDPAPELGALLLPLSAGDTEATIAYGNPFPPPWRPFLLLHVRDPWTFDLTGRRWLYTALPADSTIHVAPAITPVRALQINGADALVPQSDVGERPHLTWQPPALGAPSRYIIRLLASDGDTLLAVLRTRAPSLLLPPGLLTPGATYYLEVIAALPRALPGGAAGLMSAPISSGG